MTHQTSLLPRGAVLVTTDFSEEARVAFDIAKKEADLRKAPLALINVIEGWTLAPAIGEFIPPDSIVAYQDKVRSVVADEIKKLAEREFSGRSPVTIVEQAIDRSIGEIIADTASRNGVSLIVIASHGRGAVRQLLLGSVVQKVIQLSSCPVLVVPVKRR